MNKPYKNPVIVGCMKLGAWGAKMSTSEYEKYIDQCLELGLNEFDHADIYGAHTTEAEFGEVMAKRPDLKAKVKVTTKSGIAYPSELRDHRIKHYNSTFEYLERSIDLALKNLKMENIDVFLVHRPDFLMDHHEVAKAGEKAQSAGKINHFGVSNFLPHQFELLNSVIPLATNQVEVSVNHLEPFTDGTLTQLQKYGVQPSAWSPLAGGVIFGGQDEQSSRIREMATQLAEKKNCKIDQILLAFVMKHPSGIVPVVGTSKIDRVKDAMEAAKIDLAHEEWYELWTASIGEKVA